MDVDIHPNDLIKIFDKPAVIWKYSPGKKIYKKKLLFVCANEQYNSINDISGQDIATITIDIVYPFFKKKYFKFYYDVHKHNGNRKYIISTGDTVNIYFLSDDYILDIFDIHQLGREKYKYIIDKFTSSINDIGINVNKLALTKLTTEQNVFINNITENNYNLSQFIGDITDYINLRDNNLTIQNEPFCFRDEFTEYFENIAEKMRGLSITFNVQRDNDIPPYIIGDKFRIKQILDILVDNAIKYTYEGYININISSKILLNKSDNNKYNIKFTVSDTGKGIGADCLERIFDSFYKIENTDNGLGLGLSIARKICRLMGGRIDVSSELNRGTIFSFDFIVDEFLDMRAMEDETVMLFENRNILIIDDDAKNRVEISHILSEWKMNPYMCSTYEEASVYVEKYKIDVCFIDINSSIHQACELAKKIRKMREYIQLVAMTNDENVGYDRDIFNFMIPRPMVRKKILKLFINILTDIDMKSKFQSTGESKIFNNLPILISQYSSKINITNILRDLGYVNIDVAKSQQETIDKRRGKSGRIYSLHIMDLSNLKDADGYKILTKLEDKYKKPFIIAIVPNDKINSKRLIKNGIEAFLTTPIDMNELKALLRIISRRTSNFTA